MTTCTFHAHTGPEPCPYCLESGKTVEGAIYRDFVPSGVPWVDSCPKCTSTDLRTYEPNELHVIGYIWCGQCGGKSL